MSASTHLVKVSILMLNVLKKLKIHFLCTGLQGLVLDGSGLGNKILYLVVLKYFYSIQSNRVWPLFFFDVTQLKIATILIFLCHLQANKHTPYYRVQTGPGNMILQRDRIYHTDLWMGKHFIYSYHLSFHLSQQQDNPYFIRMDSF